MPIFTQQLSKLEYTNPNEAIRHMANHIRYIQEQLEYTLMNLDSSNITEIETDKTNISSSGGESSFSGTAISFKGNNGEVFEAGTKDGLFTFLVKGKGGSQMMYLTSGGELVITNNATMHIDGGEW